MFIGRYVTLQSRPAGPLAIAIATYMLKLWSSFLSKNYHVNSFMSGVCSDELSMIIL